MPTCSKRLQKKNRDVQFKKFLEVLKQLHINIPLVEALEQMPSYVMFFKNILTKKHRLGEFEIVCLTNKCSMILTKKIQEKMKDPSSFTIPVAIRGQKIGKTLCDLRESIKLIPLSIYKKLGMGEEKPTTVTLQLANCSITHPGCKIEMYWYKLTNSYFLLIL